MVDLTPRQAANNNPSYAGRHKMSAHNIPNVVFSVQSFIMPGITLDEAQQQTSILDIPVVGEKLIYDTLVVTVIVDEDWNNIKEVKEWMDKIAGIDMENRVTTDAEMYSDLTLTVLKNTGEKNFDLSFVDAFPTNIANIPLSHNQDADPLVTDISFRFSHFNFV